MIILRFDLLIAKFMLKPGLQGFRLAMHLQAKTL